MPSARHKLNGAHLHGALVVAGLVAAIAQSWVVFSIVAIVLTITAIHAGEIRLTKQTRDVEPCLLTPPAMRLWTVVGGLICFRCLKRTR